MFKSVIFAIFVIFVALAYATPNFSGSWTRFSHDFSGNCQTLAVEFISENNSTYSIVDSNGATLADSLQFESDGSFLGNAITVLKNGKVVTSACKGVLSNPFQLQMNILPTVWFSGSQFYFNQISLVIYPCCNINLLDNISVSVN
ncbi:hypothetical protein PPL_04569 [Heterostelium album PN500]|uniref:Uncharacterized protein n=1 Tax=Heterostelium pallidum (strain ATCC 26659 / Pp 5 / PN500) TaxID=670386 RepID=D3B7Y1_HETP5|nr:hypothetical protein PPL_04569 [Heterostelium album PN500]EFA82149.1 hypothetical protein PPL_04569 [Heterostelium album PN500]|eukprot:XP_020434266.1 hypothetical protein PPL_04569 [Heterostelium album PN500]